MTEHEELRLREVLRAAKAVVYWCQILLPDDGSRLPDTIELDIGRFGWLRDAVRDAEKAAAEPVSGSGKT